MDEMDALGDAGVDGDGDRANLEEDEEPYLVNKAFRGSVRGGMDDEMSSDFFVPDDLDEVKGQTRGQGHRRKSLSLDDGDGRRELISLEQNIANLEQSMRTNHVDSAVASADGGHVTFSSRRAMLGSSRSTSLLDEMGSTKKKKRMFNLPNVKKVQK